MKDIEEQSTSFQIKLHQVQSDQQLLNAIFNFTSEIQFYKNALANAQQLMHNYSSENYALKKQNLSLRDMIQTYEKKLKKANKQIISLEFNRKKQSQNQSQMMFKIQELSGKLEKYQETFDLLENKIIELNLQINKYTQIKKDNENYDEFDTSYKMTVSTNETPRNKLKKSQTYSVWEKQSFENKQKAGRHNYAITLHHKLKEMGRKSKVLKKSKGEDQTHSLDRQY